MAISMFGKGLIAFFSLYFSNYWMRFIKIVHCVTGIEGLWLLLLFAAAFIRFSCYCQKYLKGHAIYHWFLYPLSSVFWAICHVQNKCFWLIKKGFSNSKKSQVKCVSVYWFISVRSVVAKNTSSAYVLRFVISKSA